jgi:hypothetical protein
MEGAKANLDIIARLELVVQDLVDFQSGVSSAEAAYFNLEQTGTSHAASIFPYGRTEMTKCAAAIKQLSKSRLICLLRSV